jgi:hypothetical protein
MMTIGLYGLVAFAAIFSGAISGLLIGNALPDRYRNDATRQIVQTAMGMVSLLSALVLGLLVATAKSKFDTSNKQTDEFAADLMLLDRELVNYGEEAKDIRPILRKYTLANIAATWPRESGPKPEPGDPPAWQLLESVQRKLRGLAPQTEAQRSALTNAKETAAELTKTSWLQTAQESGHIPHPFILILILWLCILFTSFGLFAPRNALAITALLVCALSLAGAIVLIVDMDSPFEGFIAISARPMQEALARISVP